MKKFTLTIIFMLCTMMGIVAQDEPVDVTPGDIVNNVSSSGQTTLFWTPTFVDESVLSKLNATHILGTNKYGFRHKPGITIPAGGTGVQFVLNSAYNMIELSSITFTFNGTYEGVWKVEAKKLIDDVWTAISDEFTALEGPAENVVPITSNGEAYKIFRLVLAQEWTLPDPNYDNLQHVVFTVKDVANSISRTELNNSISVYPNPAQDVINLKLKADIEVAEMTLINTAGVVVKSVKNLTSVRIDELNAGVYFLEVKTTEGDMISKKVLIK